MWAKEGPLAEWVAMRNDLRRLSRSVASAEVENRLHNRRITEGEPKEKWNPLNYSRNVMSTLPA